MADNIQRNRGRGAGYKFERGGNPTEFGPFIGIVKNNVDSLRSGRLKVFIEEFAGDNQEDESLWRTVSYVPPFYGIVGQSGTDKGAGSYIGNPQSYGMWFTPPDLGTRVICFFASGDPDQGFYIGCLPDPGINYMIPGIGASKKFELDNSSQAPYFKTATQLPVVEINVDNKSIDEDPRFFDQVRPVHSYVASVLLQQGLINDTVRGPITSSSQRESPSAVYGISTPGRSVTQGSINEDNINEKINSNDVQFQDIKVIGRRAGHSFIMDDGNNEGFDNLIRIRTGKGHQITMSDDGDCFYITHANGQTWLEFGSEGTVDVFSTNSVNVRTQGEINLHADKNINMYAGEAIRLKSKNIQVHGSQITEVIGQASLMMNSTGPVALTSSTTLSLSSTYGSWDGGGLLALKGGLIDLNGGLAPPALPTPSLLPDLQLPDTKFKQGQGWQVEQGKLTSIVSRAPTHEPYPYHNRGVDLSVSMEEGAGSAAISSGTIPSVPGTPTAGAIEKLTNTPVTAPIDAANIIKQTPALDSIGNLNVNDVTSLMSSTAASVGQSINDVTAEGVGKYGLSLPQLEQTGLLKFGTVKRFGEDAINVLSSPGSWTGKLSVGTLDSLTSNATVQDFIQQDLLKTSYAGLSVSGVLSGLESKAQVGALIQSAVATSPAAVANWAKGQASAFVTNQINNISKNALQSINLVAGIANSITGGLVGGLIVNITGAIDTVARQTIDQTVTAVIANQKVLPPEFKPRERPADGSATRIDIRSIQRTARNNAISEALASGKSEAEADAIGNRAGNLAGVEAFKKLN